MARDLQIAWAQRCGDRQLTKTAYGVMLSATLREIVPTSAKHSETTWSIVTQHREASQTKMTDSEVRIPDRSQIGQDR